MRELDLLEMENIEGGQRCSRAAIGTGLAIISIGIGIFTMGIGGVLMGAIGGIVSASGLTGCGYSWE
ncbi:MAG: hypothetical protein KAJ23_11040 [Maribacter sp.]|nr:hypothetical protein [Maribacter sp.]